MEEATIRGLRERLRRLRKDCGWTQEDVADFAKIDYKFYQSIEAGRRKELRVSTLERIARAFGLQAHDLLAPECPIPSPNLLMKGSTGQYSVGPIRKKSSKTR